MAAGFHRHKDSRHEWSRVIQQDTEITSQPPQKTIPGKRLVKNAKEESPMQPHFSTSSHLARERQTDILCASDVFVSDSMVAE